MQWAGSMFSVFFREAAGAELRRRPGEATEAFAAFFHAMLSQGVHLPPSSFEAWFVSAAHDDEAVDHVLAVGTGRVPGRGPRVCDNRRMNPPVTVVHLMRHGEVHNPEGILYGRLPGYRLSELGLEMAETVARFLAVQDVVRVVASPLERAQETAVPIAATFDLPVETDDRLIEAGNYFEGKTFGVGDGALSKPSVWPRLLNPFAVIGAAAMARSRRCPRDP